MVRYYYVVVEVDVFDVVEVRVVWREGGYCFVKLGRVRMYGMKFGYDVLVEVDDGVGLVVVVVGDFDCGEFGQSCKQGEVGVVFDVVVVWDVVVIFVDFEVFDYFGVIL